MGDLPLPGTLYVVATPIGNLADLSPRAVEVLRAASAVLCEDTRVTRVLLAAHGVETPTIAHHAHSPAEHVGRLVERLRSGETLALVSDAGTPLVSDPGLELVRAAIAVGVPIVPIPGPSALLAALVGSGLPAQPFAFLGFLPRGRSEQVEVVTPFARLGCTLVLYESPHRVVATLGLLAQVLGRDRRACVAREMTKRFETFERGTLAELAERLGERVRGEVVLVIGPPDGPGRPDGGERLEEEARRLLAEGSAPSEAARVLAGALGVPKREAYEVLLRLSQAERGGDD